MHHPVPPKWDEVLIMEHIAIRQLHEMVASFSATPGVWAAKL
jgi:hypothetical protein